MPEPETGLKFRSGPCSSRLMARTSDKDAMPSWTGTREYPPTPTLLRVRTTEALGQQSGRVVPFLSYPVALQARDRGQPNPASQRAQESVLGLREPAG